MTHQTPHHHQAILIIKSNYGNFFTDCPKGTFQDTPSGNACKACPLNSIQDASKMKCDCVPSFYREKDETIFDKCTGTYSNVNILTIH